MYETECRQFREVSRTRAIYNTETHTSDFIFNTSEMGSQCSFPGEVLSGGGRVPKERVLHSCSKVLNFLERLDDKIRCTHNDKETVAVVKP